MAEDAVDQVRERTDIVEVIGQHVALRKAGRNFKGLCPFHQEKTPSFIVFPDSQNFHCFGCGAGGDVFNFVMQLERVDFREALRELAARAGVELEQRAPTPPEQIEQHSRLYELNRRAASWFAHVLWQTSAGEAGRELLEKRGVDRAAAEKFLLGFAPDRWDALLGIFTRRGATVDEMVAAGLATQRDDGGAYDRFRNRLIFPIRDREGRVVGFGGRAMGDAQPKYLNSPQTVIFDKSANLYAFDLAQEAIRRAHEVVVVEGYMDAIAAHQFGFENVVASMGTALTEPQVRMLRRGVDRIILALDADVAGQMATVRGLDVLRENLSEADRPYLDQAAGLVRFERTLKTDIRIVRLPSGKDPDELIRKDVAAWQAALGGAVPLLDFYVDAVVGEQPPADPRSKSEIVERVIPVLREIGDRVVQEHYLREVARRLAIDERTLASMLAAPRRERGRPRPVPPRLPEVRRPAATAEEHLIALLLRNPQVLAPLLAEIDDHDILDARRQGILRHLRAVGPDSTEAALLDLPDELREHAARLLETVEDRPAGYLGQLKREAEGALRRLRKQHHDFQMQRLMADIAQAAREDDQEAVRHGLELADQLKARYPEFYPEPSPYFRDARDTG